MASTHPSDDVGPALSIFLLLLSAAYKAHAYDDEDALASDIAWVIEMRRHHAPDADLVDYITQTHIALCDC